MAATVPDNLPGRHRRDLHDRLRLLDDRRQVWVQIKDVLWNRLLPVLPRLRPLGIQVLVLLSADQQLCQGWYFTNLKDHLKKLLDHVDYLLVRAMRLGNLCGD